MDPTDLARIQFATTSIYHFVFVPVTIGLAFLVAVLHTQWYRSGQEDHKRLTRFFGTLLLINVAVGVVTGLVQEFQFGMNWSAYSRFVGDVFGAPLAMEGLAAFFLESTFLGLWLFGWNVLPRRIHLATIWLVAVGASLSAAFIMAANSWMQHPVGYTTNAQTGRPQLSSIGDLFTNPVFVWGYIHVILASLVTGQPVPPPARLAPLQFTASAWQERPDGQPVDDHRPWRPGERHALTPLARCEAPEALDPETRLHERLGSLGPASVPRQNGELVFDAPWQGRIFGMAVALSEEGLVPWEEFRQALIAAVAAAEARGGDFHYYEVWLAAFERVLGARGLVGSGELEEAAYQFEFGERDEVF